jgi:hypothetical protein
MKLLIQTQASDNGNHISKDYSYALGKYGRSEEALTELVMALRTKIDSKEHIVGWYMVEDNYLTDFEKSQLEYDGKIVYPTRVLTLGEVNV